MEHIRQSQFIPAMLVAAKLTLQLVKVNLKWALFTKQELSSNPVGQYLHLRAVCKCIKFL